MLERGLKPCPIHALSTPYPRPIYALSTSVSLSSRYSWDGWLRDVRLNLLSSAVVTKPMTYANASLDNNLPFMSAKIETLPGYAVLLAPRHAVTVYMPRWQMVERYSINS